MGFDIPSSSASMSPSSLASTIIIPGHKGKGKGKDKDKGKGKSADQDDGDPTGGPATDEAEQHQDERHASHKHDCQVLHLPVVPANAGDSKEDWLIFLAGLSKCNNYQDMVQWLEANLVLDCPLLYHDWHGG